MTASRLRRPVVARTGVAGFLVVVASVGFAGLNAGVAGAGAPPATLSFTTPASDGQTLNQAPISLGGQVSRPGGNVQNVTITVRWVDTAAGRVPGPHPSQTTAFAPPSRGPDYTWAFTPNLSYNGRYAVSVTAATTDSSGSSPLQTTGSDTFVVDVNPQAPANVTETTDTNQRVVHLTWTPNPEPDLIGYEILRAGPGPSSPSSVINGVQAPDASYTDDEVATEPPGTYRYQIVAVRQSGSGNQPDLSTPSAGGSATFTTPPKTVAPTTVPPPTTTPGKPGTGPGSPGAGTGTGHPGATTPVLVLPVVRPSLPDYGKLVAQARATTATTAPPDPGFATRLPYQPQISRQPVTLPALDSLGTLGSSDSTGRVANQTAEFIAGALLLGVLALFALIIKRSAEQSGVLEALAPARVGDPSVFAPVLAEPAAFASSGARLGHPAGDPADATEAEVAGSGVAGPAVTGPVITGPVVMGRAVTRPEGPEVAGDVGPAGPEVDGPQVAGDVGPEIYDPEIDPVVAGPAGPVVAGPEVAAPAGEAFGGPPTPQRRTRRSKWAERAAALATALAAEPAEREAPEAAPVPPPRPAVAQPEPVDLSPLPPTLTISPRPSFSPMVSAAVGPPQRMAGEVVPVAPVAAAPEGDEWLDDDSLPPLLLTLYKRAGNLGDEVEAPIELADELVWAPTQRGRRWRDLVAPDPVTAGTAPVADFAHRD